MVTMPDMHERSEDKIRIRELEMAVIRWANADRDYDLYRFDDDQKVRAHYAVSLAEAKAALVKMVKP